MPEWPREWRCRAAALDPGKGTDSKFGDYAAFVMLVVSGDSQVFIDADLALRNTP